MFLKLIKEKQNNITKTMNLNNTTLLWGMGLAMMLTNSTDAFAATKGDGQTRQEMI